AAGFVDSLARPGGNATGFMNYEYSIGAKWLELLKQTAPGVTRAAVLRDASQSSGTSMLASVQTVAPSLRVEVNPINMRDAGEIERAVTAFARSPGGGLVVVASPAATRHRDLIIKLAARHKLPAVYYERFFVAGGGPPTVMISSTSTGAPPATSIASSRAKSQPTCQCRRRPSTS
ncbi:MAG: ABC transporter substrate binding protein, partial [Pseudolabrys sp.]